MKLRNFLLSGALALMLVGCSSSPEDAVYGMYDALKNGDVENLSQHATDTTAGLLMMGAMMECGLSESDYSSEDKFISDCMKSSFKGGSISKVEVVEETETKATVNVYNEDGSKEEMNLVKVDGNWKVNITK